MGTNLILLEKLNDQCSKKIECRRLPRRPYDRRIDCRDLGIMDRILGAGGSLDSQRDSYRRCVPDEAPEMIFLGGMPSYIGASYWAGPGQ